MFFPPAKIHIFSGMARLVSVFCIFTFEKGLLVAFILLIDRRIVGKMLNFMVNGIVVSNFLVTLQRIFCSVAEGLFSAY